MDISRVSGFTKAAIGFGASLIGSSLLDRTHDVKERSLPLLNLKEIRLPSLSSVVFMDAPPQTNSSIKEAPSKSYLTGMKDWAWALSQNVRGGITDETFIRENSWALRYASTELTNDKNFMLSLLQDKLWIQSLSSFCSDGILRYAGPLLRKDPSYLLLLVKQNMLPISSFPKELQEDKNFILAILKQGTSADVSQFIKKWPNDPEIVLAAVQLDGKAFIFASSELRRNPRVILAALQSKKPFLEAILGMLNELSHDKTLMLAAIRLKGELFHYTSINLKSDPDIALAALQSQQPYIKVVSEGSNKIRDHKRVMLAAIHLDGRTFHFASDRLKNDPEVVAATLESKKPYVAPTYTDDQREVYKREMVAAVKENGSFFYLANDELKNDPEVVLAALESDQPWGLALPLAGDKPKDDTRVVLAAVKLDALLLQYASARLQKSSLIHFAASFARAATARDD